MPRLKLLVVAVAVILIVVGTANWQKVDQVLHSFAAGSGAGQDLPCPACASLKYGFVPTCDGPKCRCDQCGGQLPSEWCRGGSLFSEQSRLSVGSGMSDTSTKAAQNKLQAFIRTTANGMFKLEPQITNLPGSMLLKIRPTRVSDGGQVIGPGSFDPAGTVLVLTPE